MLPNLATFVLIGVVRVLLRYPPALSQCDILCVHVLAMPTCDGVISSWNRALKMEYIDFNVLRFQQWFMRMLEHDESFVNGNFKRNCWNVL